MFKNYQWRLLHPTDGGGGAPATAPSASEGGQLEEDGNAAAEPEGELGGGAEEDTITMPKSQYDEALANARQAALDEANTQSTETTTGSQEGDSSTSTGEDVAQAKLEQGNQRILAATIKELGSPKMFSANGLKLAAKLIPLTECLDEKGDVDENIVADKMDDFIQQYPELKAVPEVRPRIVYEGNPQGGGQSGMTKDQIMQIPNRKKRLQAIEDNMHLFQ